MSAILSLKNLNLSFGQKTIFSDAQISISKGDRIGLIGLNGHGKTTLFNIIMEKLNPDISNPPFIYSKNKTNFSIFHVPQELDLNSFKDLKIKNYFLAFYPVLYKLSLEIKDIEDQIEKASIEELKKLIEKQDQLYSKYEFLKGWEIQANYENYLQAFDLDDTHRSLNNLSGGELRKIALSAGLSNPYELTLWDEPTNHLDIETIIKFEELLLNSGKSFLVISHDRYFLNNVTNQIFHIEFGKINDFKGSFFEYMAHVENVEKERAKNLDKLKNKHKRELSWMRQGVKARRTRSKKRVENYQQLKSRIEDLKSKSKKIVNLSLTHSGRQSKELVSIKDGSFSFDDKLIFKDLNLSICRGDKLALIGKNGAGKSTLINIFREKLCLKNGKFKSAEELKIIVFDQKRESLDLSKTPIEVVGDGQDFIHFQDGRSKHVHSYLENFLFTKDQLKDPISKLSGGEKNRLQLALFMKQSADLWVFDEPTNDLDIETIEILENEISNYQSAVIIIGHDRAFLQNTCNKTWLINDKSVEVFEGGYDQVSEYLEALELEREMSKEEKVSKPKKEKTSTAKSDSPTKDVSFDLKKVEDEISIAEDIYDKIQNMMASYDFSNMSDQKKKDFDDLTNKSNLLQNKIESLYKKWEKLSNA